MADEPRKLRAVILVGQNPIREMLAGQNPLVAIGVDVSWDEAAGAWRADWDGGVQFGKSELEAALNGLRQRLVSTD